MSADSQPISRRDAWLTVALAVARDGLPEPRDLNIYETNDGDAGNIFARAHSVADLERWAAAFGLERRRAHASSDGKQMLHSCYGRYRGWWICVDASGPVEVLVAPDPLAAEVVAAILTPDAPSLPEVVSA